MEKADTLLSSKDNPEDPIIVDKEGTNTDGSENKKEVIVEKVATDKEEGGQKNDVNPVIPKRERQSSSTARTPLRSTRSSNNPEFVAKQRNFLQKVNQGAFYQSEEEGEHGVTNGSTSLLNKRKRSMSGGPINVEPVISLKSVGNDAASAPHNVQSPSPSNVSGIKQGLLPKKRRSEVEGLTRDVYCWVCHKEMGVTNGGSTLSCEVCPRVYHARCCHSMENSSPAVSPSPSNALPFSRKGWACPECVKIVRAETMGTRSRAMQLISMDQLCTLLKHVLVRVRTVTGAEPFFCPVDLQQFPRYREYVANPMDLGLVDRNIRRRTYGSTEAFLADMKWIVHNSIIFNTQHSKLTSIARSMIKVCRQELMEIENCPDCYANAHTRKDDWFIEVCRRPHILVWAKLKGFPHWPAKAMRVNKESCVDVRFFGAHDRAWVPAKDCFLYSEEMPAPPKNRKKNNLDGCIEEVEDHIKKLKEKFGLFVYAPFRTVFDPAQEEQIIKTMLPRYQPPPLERLEVHQAKCVPERRISRESPCISAGTEESEEDHSLDGDGQSIPKPGFDTLEDSMEVPTVPETSKPDVTEGTQSLVAETINTGKESESDKKMENKKEKDEMEKIDNKEQEEKKQSTENIEESGVHHDLSIKHKKIKLEDEVVEQKEEVDNKVGEKKDEESSTEEVVANVAVEKVCDSESDEKMKTGSENVEVGDEGEKEKVSEVIEGEEEKKGNEKVEDERKLSKPSVEAKHESQSSSTNILHEPENSVDSLEDDVTDVEKKVEEDKSPESGDNSVGNIVNEKFAGTDIEEDSMWDNMPVDDDARLSGNVNAVSLIESLKAVTVEMEKPAMAVLETSTDKIEEKEMASKIVVDADDTSSDIDKKVMKNNVDKDEEKISSENSDTGDILKDKQEKSEIGKVSTTTSEKKFSEVLQTAETKITERVTLKEVVSDGKGETDAALNIDKQKQCPSTVIQEKIDVNKLRESLMTKCANVSIAAGEVNQVSELNKTKKDLVLANALHPETGALMAVEPSGEEPVVEEGSTDGAVVEEKNNKKLPAKVGGGAESSASNKGDVGSQLRLLGKLQERLSFASDSSSDDDETREKVDEVVGEESEAAVVEATCSSSSDIEEDEASVKVKHAGKNKSKTPKDITGTVNKDSGTVNKDSETVKKDSKSVEKDSISVEKDSKSAEKDSKSVEKDSKSVEKDSETVEKDSETVEKDSETVKKDSKRIEKDSETSEKSAAVESETLEKDKEVSNAEAEKVLQISDTNKESRIEEKNSQVETPGEKQALKEDEGKGDEKKVNENSEKSVEVKKERGTKVARDDQEKQSKSNEVETVKEMTRAIDTIKESEIRKETIQAKEKRIDKISEELINAQKLAKLKAKAHESKISDTDAPSSPKKAKLSETRGHDVEVVAVKPKPLLKREDVIEEEVLNREVLKENNVVVVQKTVKTRKLEEESIPPSAPKRARKGVAHKAIIMDRSESPSQDDIFPSMFLDPSVTITVHEEVEKGSGNSKDQVNKTPSVEELRTSVNLSSDVSLTMVRPTPLECLAAAQDSVISRVSDQTQVDIASVSAQNSASMTSSQSKPRARKSFPRPTPRVMAPSPQPLTQNSSMEVRRIPIPMNGRDISSSIVTAVPSQIRNTPGVLTPPTVSMRALLTSATIPPTTLTISSVSSTTSSISPSISSSCQVLPSSSGVPSPSPSPSMSSRLPNLQPRPASYPLSRPQPIYGPSEAGPLSSDFNKHAHKLATYMRTAIEDILSDLSGMGNAEAALKLMKLDMEKLKWEHQREISELKRNQDLVIMEMRNNFEKEKVRCINEVRKHCEAEKVRAVEETKRKQWCANCSKEALFYCCWNTSYCDYPCQQDHWPRHMASCAQNNGVSENAEGESGSKDGNSSGLKALPSTSSPSPFHQLQRPGATNQESLPEEEYYDEDSNSPSTTRMGTSGGTYRVKRRRCGMCKGCLVKNNCGNCAPCRNAKTHQVCRMRRCRSLQSDWVPSTASGRATPQTISPEPGTPTVSLKAPPLTYASKKRKGSSKSSPLAIMPPNPVDLSPSSLPHANGEVSDSGVNASTSSINESFPYVSQSSHLSPQSQQQASAVDHPPQPVASPQTQPRSLSQAMNPYAPISSPFSHNISNIHYGSEPCGPNCPDILAQSQQFNPQVQQPVPQPQSFGPHLQQFNPNTQQLISQPQQLHQPIPQTQSFNPQLQQFNPNSQQIISQTHPPTTNSQSQSFNPQPQQFNSKSQQRRQRTPQPQQMNILSQQPSSQTPPFNFQSPQLNLPVQRVQPQPQQLQRLKSQIQQLASQSHQLNLQSQQVNIQPPQPSPQQKLPNPQPSHPTSVIQPPRYSLHQPHLNPQQSPSRGHRTEPSSPQMTHLPFQNPHNPYAMLPPIPNSPQTSSLPQQSPHAFPQPTQNGNPFRFPHPEVSPPIHNSPDIQRPSSIPEPSYLQNPFLYPPMSSTSVIPPPYTQEANLPSPGSYSPRSRASNSQAGAPRARSRTRSRARTRGKTQTESSIGNTGLPSNHPDAINSLYTTTYSSTSLIVPNQPNIPSPHQFLFPNHLNASRASLVEQHQIHRQRMAAGVDLFNESMRISVRPSYFA